MSGSQNRIKQKTDTLSSIQTLLGVFFMEQQEEIIEQADLTEEDKNFVDSIIDKLLLICNELLPEGQSLRPYQVPFVRRIFNSLITNDGGRITALFSRQS